MVTRMDMATVMMTRRRTMTRKEVQKTLEQAG